ncbi:hypothetical protein KPH14_000914, partial [Odynerus spinipes]
LVDNCPAHPQITGLKFISLVFLPPNTTSVLQAMDQGIIRALKTNFRKNLVLKTIEHIDTNQELSTVKFKNAGFFQNSDISSSQDVNEQNSVTEFDVENDMPLVLWVRN